MGSVIGMIFGVTIGMFFLGYLAAWIIRKVVGITKIQSYLIGVPLMTFVGAWSISFDSDRSFLSAWLAYLLGGAIALPLMIAVARKEQSKGRGSIDN